MNSKKSSSSPDGALEVSGRRNFLKQASLLAAGVQAGTILPLAAATSSASTMAPDTKALRKNADVVAETTSGKIRGTTVEGVKVFKGIPYGGTTAGKNRFMPPTKPAPWTGVREAIEFGRVAPQPFSGGRIDYVRLIDWFYPPSAQGEDCLALNVWTPAIKDGGKRPVLVCFHGGGFTSGSGSNPGFHGQELARQHNAVGVSVNHRLGCLGYMNLAGLGAPPEFARSGVAGALDMVAALEWVRDNIENFGGDPGNVMIFGQSGGGAKVCTLLAMPAAKGLFHRAAIQSGSALRLTSRETATRSAERMLAQIGLDNSRVTELQDVPVEMMMSAQAALGAQSPPFGFGPMVDGAVIPQNPFDPIAPAISADIPLIVSTTLDDAALGRTDFSLDEAGLQAQVKTIAGNEADRVIGAYRRAYPSTTPFLLLCRMLTDRGGRKSAVTLAERKFAQHKAPVYMYLFSWPSPGYGGKFGAVHGTDVPLVVGNNRAQGITGTGPVARALAEKMSAAWVAFAKTGNPNHPGLPQWPAYTPETRGTMVFDSTCRVENDPAGDLRRLWDDVKA